VIADVLHLALGEIEVEHAEELAVRAGIGDERAAAGIPDQDRLRHGIMGMAAENDVDAGHAARELEVDVHAVVREQEYGIDLVLFTMRGDELLQLVVADAKSPVRREAPGVRDRDIGESLADHGDAIAADLLDRGRLEYAAGGRIERLCVVESRFV